MCMDNAEALNIVTTEPQFLLLHYYFYYLQNNYTPATATITTTTTVHNVYIVSPSKGRHQTHGSNCVKPITYQEWWDLNKLLNCKFRGEFVNERILKIGWCYKITAMSLVNQSINHAFLDWSK